MHERGNPTGRLLHPEAEHEMMRTRKSLCPRANLHMITQEALRLDFAFANSHPFHVINKIGDRKLIQPFDALFMPRHTVMIDLQQLIHANEVWALNVKVKGGEIWGPREVAFLTLFVTRKLWGS